MKRASSTRWDFLAAFLLLLALLTSAERVVATTWTEGLGIMFTTTFLGLILGLALGYSRFKRTGIHLLTFGYSLTILPWTLSAAQYPGMAWQESLGNLGGRLANSFGLFFTRQPVEDPILFILLAAALYWILGIHAAYAFSRRESFVAGILPAGIVLFTVQLYDNWVGARVGLLAFYLFVSLLLLGRLRYTQKRREWNEHRVWISSDSTTDLNLTLLFTALVVILLAWVAPSPVKPVTSARSLWEDIIRPLKQAREDLGNAVAGLEHGGGGEATADFYGDAMTLGLEGASGDNVLFAVRVPTTLGNIPNYYWRVRIYDTYFNNQWHLAPAGARNITPRRPPETTFDESLWPSAEFIFSSPSESFSILIAPPRPVWISRPATMTYISVNRETEEPVFFTVNPIIQPGETYTVHAAMANPSEVQLRAAGKEYPAWVTDRYLQLPDKFPPSIADLARQVTAGYSNPYDQTNAITNYLRANITYNRQVLPAPAGEDPVVWFLNSREGFCNYYATAEVLMLRSIGIPARLAVGFAEGEKQNPDRRIVRQRDAHAWPEVYFPGIGWIEFEPTSSISVIVRPSGIAATPVGGINPAASTPSAENAATQEAESGGGLPVDGTGSGSGTPNSMRRIVLFLVIIFAVIGLAAFLLFVGVGEKAQRRWQRIIQVPLPVRIASAFDALSLPQPAWLERWVRRARLGIVERSFETVYRSLRWLGAKPDPARTPAQAAALLASLLPACAVDLDLMLREYEHTLFSTAPGSAPIARRAAASIRSLALRAAITKRLDAVRRVFARHGEKG